MKAIALFLIAAACFVAAESESAWIVSLGILAGLGFAALAVTQL